MQEIESIIDELYEQSFITKWKSEPVRNKIHVSDLTSDCMRKAWYRLTDTARDMKDFKKVLPLVHGTALHDACNLGGVEHELSMFCNIKEMKSEPVHYVLGESKPTNLYSCIAGSMDDLVEIDDELIICDKKTIKKGLPKTVSDQYKAQMNIYKLLYFITTGVEISRAAIIYIEKVSAWERHRTVVFDLQPIEEIRTFVLDKLSILDTEQAPPRVKTFLCPWCDYYNTCKP